ncbi:MAG TPA: hypothetical protein VGI56_12460 [Galbitalea sp.]|jgi:hypothetical protein
MKDLADIELDAMLAPEPVRAAAISTYIGIMTFLVIAGRPPSETAVNENFVRALIACGAGPDDLQWAIEAGYLPQEGYVIWDEVSREHA